MRHSAFHLPEKPIIELHGSPSELRALDRLQRYDTLPSPYAFSGMEYYGRTVQTRLIKAQAIRIPQFARQWAVKRNVHYPLEITPIGERVLAQAGRWLGRQKGGDHFEHKYYRSVAEFLFDYAATTIDGLRVKMLADLLADLRCPAATATDEHPERLYLSEKQYIVPDFYRGYEYRALATIHFFVEVDRNTEPLTSRADRQNIQDKINAYDRFFAENGFEERYGITQASVLWITTEEFRKDAILFLLSKSLYPRQHAIQVLPDFIKGFPPPSDRMVSQPWVRVGGELDILAILKETATKKEMRREPRHQDSQGRGTDIEA